MKWESRDRKHRKKQPIHGKSVFAILAAVLKRGKLDKKSDPR